MVPRWSKSPWLLGHTPAIINSCLWGFCDLRTAPCFGKQLEKSFVVFGWKLNPSHQSRSAEQYRAQAASESTTLWSFGLIIFDSACHLCLVKQPLLILPWYHDSLLWLPDGWEGLGIRNKRILIVSMIVVLVNANKVNGICEVDHQQLSYINLCCLSATAATSQGSAINLTGDILNVTYITNRVGVKYSGLL